MPIPTNALLLIAVVALLASCKKDDAEEDAPIAPPDPNAAYSVTDFSQLTEGNYWVYERMNYDSNGVVWSGPVLDSFFFATDTILDGHSYMVQRRAAAGSATSIIWRYLRDSADCIISHGGQIVFRYGVFDQVAWADTVPFSLYVDHSISSTPTQQVVPAGTFTAYKVLGTVGMISTGLLPVPPSRYPYYYWSPGVGKVKQMEPYVSSGIMAVSELVRYNVE